MSFRCPVCGFPDLTKPPRNPVSGGASHEICPSCGYQFGYDDDLHEISYDAWRTAWEDAGKPWRSSQPVPVGWDPDAQLRALISEGANGQSGQ